MREQPKASEVSIVIPALDNVDEVENLVKQLREISSVFEIIVCGVKDIFPVPDGVNYLKSRIGRAKQLNLGAVNASRDFLWFIHSDTVFNRRGKNLIKGFENMDSSSIYFFDLSFYGHNALMKINECGVYIRSHIFGMPFGDQAFICHKDIYNKLGGFPEDKRVGEDHYFVWSAKRNGFKIKPIGFKVSTSAIKYKDNGWFVMTFKHLFLTYKQAIPEFLKVLWKR